MPPPRAQGDRYVADIKAGLQSALDRAGQRATGLLDLDSDRMVVFSDQHRGIRNGADDFEPCERAYNAALGYYYELGYTLVVLGDAEELWEENAGAVVRAYRGSLSLESEFHAAGRYLRVWGNHDDEWAYPGSVAHHLGPVFTAGPELSVEESLLFRVGRSGKQLGMLFLVHGHQGTGASDRWRGLARWPVRYGWRPLQRFFNLSVNTPATDWRLGGRHNRAMHEWAQERSDFVLIAGHTHRPVFASRLHAVALEGELAERQAKLAAAPDDPQLLLELARARARLEWSRSQDRAPTNEERAEVGKPAYFNAGCCCYADGDITGLELANGKIRLVRWPDDSGAPTPHVLASADLERVFADCA